MRAARRVVRLRRRDALAWLGFPGTEAAVRVFAKIPSDELDVPLLLDVRRGLGDPDASRLLAHVPTVRRGVARVVADSELRSLVSPRLLADMAEQGQEGKSIRWAAAMRSCVAWAEVSEKPLSPLRDLAHLDRLHEALWHESLQREQEGWLNAVLPRPPVPGSPDIQPLVDVATIQHEGVSMGHCAASYVPEVYRGAAYLYRVLSPERATLELRPEDGRWVRTQLKGRGNTEVDAATYRAVDAWLGAAH